MKMRSFAETQIISIIMEYMAGTSVKAICRKYGISDTTFYNWKNRYFGTTQPAAAQKLHLESKSGRLKRLYEFIAKENLALRAFIDSAITEENNRNSRLLSGQRANSTFIQTSK
jgi:putative transposase